MFAQDAPADTTADSGRPPDWIQPADTQPEATGDWVRPPDGDARAPVLGNQAAVVLRSQAYRIDMDAKLAVIRTLESIHESEEIPPSDELAVEILSFLATEAFDYQVRRDGRVINDFPLVRAQAVYLLGAIGGPAASATVKRVLLHEEDSYVLAAAVSAAAASARHADPELLERMTLLVQRMNALRRPDNALALSVIRAVRELHTRAGPIDDPDLFRSLIAIAQGGYAASVRRDAVEVIDLLRKQYESQP